MCKLLITGIFGCAFLFNNLFSLPIDKIKDTFSVDVEGQKQTIFPFEKSYLSPALGAAWWESGIIHNYYKYADTNTSTSKLICSLFHMIHGALGPTNLQVSPGAHLHSKLIGKIIGMIEAFRSGKKNEIQLKDDIKNLISNDPDYKSDLKTMEENYHTKKDAYDQSQKVYKNFKTDDVQKAKQLIAQKMRLITAQKSERAQILVEILNNKKNYHKQTCVELMESINSINNDDYVSLRKEVSHIAINLKDDADDKETKKQILSKINVIINEPSEAAKQATAFYQSHKERLNDIETQKDPTKMCEAIENFMKALSESPLTQEEKEDLVGSIKMESIKESIKNAKEAQENENRARKDLADADTKALENRLDAFVNDLVGSLRESQSDVSLFLPNITEIILTSFLYAKAQERADMSAYFTALNEELPEANKIEQKVMDVIQSPVWQQLTYTSEDSKSLYETNLTGFELFKMINEQVDVFVYAGAMSNYQQALPKVTTWKNVLFEGIQFADCMDSMMLTLVGCVTFDNKTGMFTLGKHDNDSDVKLKAFMAQGRYQKATSVNDQVTHQAWVDVIENRPYVSYVRAFDTATKAVFYAPAECAGFIHKLNDTQTARTPIQLNGQAFQRIDIGNKYYIEVDPNKIKLFELNTTLKNVSTLLNSLLGLNLYDGASSEDAFLKAGFHATYWRELCQKLGWECTQDDTLDLDIADYSSLALSMTVKGEQFKISLNTGHGEIEKLTLDKEETSLERRFKEALLPKISTIIGLEKQLYIGTLSPLYCAAKLTFEDALSLNALQHVFFTKVIKNDVANELGAILSTNNKHAIGIALNVFNRIYANNNFENPELYTTCNALLPYAPNTIQAQALKIGNFGMKSPDLLIVRETLKLYAMLAQCNIGIDDAIAAAKIGMQNSEYIISNEALVLFGHLCEKGQGYSAAIAAAVEGMKNKFTIDRAVVLFGQLFEKGQGYSAAIAAAVEGMENKETNFFAVKLFGQLFEKGQGYSAAIAVAVEGMKNKKTSSDAMNLFNELVKKGQGYDVAIKMAIKYITHRDLCSNAIILLEELFKKEQGYNDAIKQASQLIKEKNTAIYAIRLYEALVKKGYCHKEAIAAVGVMEKDNLTKENKFVIALHKALSEQTVLHK